MSESRRTIVINVDVQGQPPFSYEGADKFSKKHVKDDGDIDLRLDGNSGLGEPLDLEFRLSNTEATVDGAVHDLEFSGPGSIVIKEQTPPEEKYLKALAGNPQFHGYTNPDGDNSRLRVSNRNKGGEYKYTLQVKARARDSGAEQPLVHDPKIKNTGAGAA